MIMGSFDRIATAITHDHETSRRTSVKEVA
jgi:hypothetical protein